MYGARTSLLIVLSVLAISAVVGVPLGIVAGATGGWVDDVIMRITDIFLAFPALLLSLALATVLSPSASHAAIAIAVTWWPWYARLARGSAKAIASRGYVEAARGAGRPALEGARPPRAAQRAAADDRAAVARRGGHHADRGGAVVPGPRRAGPDAGVGADGQPGPGPAGDELVGGDRAGRWRSWSRPSASTCSATGCGRCSIRRRGGGDDRGAGSRGGVRRARGRAGRVAGPERRRDRRPGRRVAARASR